MNWMLIGVGVSELVAGYLLWALWRSSELLIFKISYTLLALIPFVGPIIVVSIANIPPPQAKAFQDQEKYGSDVFSRWRHVLTEKNSYKKFRLWQTMVDKDEDNNK